MFLLTRRSPAGSLAAAESTGELKTGHRNRWFIFATDFQIDLGFVVSAFVPMIVVLATGENHLEQPGGFALQWVLSPLSACCIFGQIYHQLLSLIKDPDPP